MLLRFFIKTIEFEKAGESGESIVSLLPEDYIDSYRVDIKTYWGFDDLTLVEVNIKLTRPLENEIKNHFLNQIASKWEFFSTEEAVSSERMKNCVLLFDLEMINVFF